tara:strand:- start:97 stop:348 length:252 start_codon:yes stop_codon:yes gene_type:complete
MQTESKTNSTHNADSGQYHDDFDVLFDEGHSFVFGGANVMLSVIPFHHPTRFFTLIADSYMAVFFLAILLVVFTTTAAVSHFC